MSQWVICSISFSFGCVGGLGGNHLNGRKARDSPNNSTFIGSLRSFIFIVVCFWCGVSCRIHYQRIGAYCCPGEMATGQVRHGIPMIRAQGSCSTSPSGPEPKAFFEGETNPQTATTSTTAGDSQRATCVRYHTHTHTYVHTCKHAFILCTCRRACIHFYASALHEWYICIYACPLFPKSTNIALFIILRFSMRSVTSKPVWGKWDSRFPGHLFPVSWTSRILSTGRKRLAAPDQEHTFLLSIRVVRKVHYGSFTVPGSAPWLCFSYHFAGEKTADLRF